MMSSGCEVAGPINIGNPGEFTILELAETILQKPRDRPSSSSKTYHRMILSNVAQT